MVWDGDAASKSLLDWAERDGGLSKQKLTKYFLVINGSGKNRTDYGWPIGDAFNGEPKLNLDGLTTAFGFAKGAMTGTANYPLARTIVNKIKGEYGKEKLTEGMLDFMERHMDEAPKFENASPIDGILNETDEYIDTSVVLAKEGIFRGTDNEPRLKTFEALQESAKWMLGTPITNGHIPGRVGPDTRKIGQIISVEARPDKKDIFGTARFYKNALNEDELKHLHAGSPIDGSIGYRTPVKYESGKWQDEDYVGIETGPYTLDEYAILPGAVGACTSDQGCGIFQNAAPSLILVDGEVKKRADCPKQVKKMVDDSQYEELKKLHNSALDEISTLKAEIEKIKNAAPDLKPLLDKITELETARTSDAETIKSLNAAFEAKNTAEAQAKEDAFKAEFAKSLNAAAATEVDKLWSEVKDLKPMEFEAWKLKNSAKLLEETEKKGFRGNKLANSAPSDVVAEAKKRADDKLFGRK